MKLHRIVEEKRKQMEKNKRKEAAKNVAVGTAIGTALGAAAGLLFAPKAGKETRDDISKVSMDVAENIKTVVSDQIENTKEWSEKVKTEVKQNWEDFKEKKQDIAEETVVTAELVKEDVNEGLASVGEILMDNNEDTQNELK